MDQFTKEDIKMGKNKDLDCFVGVMEVLMKVNLWIMKSKEKENITGSLLKSIDSFLLGLMVGNLMENGFIIKFMEKEFLLGLMGNIIMESIIWIKRKDLVNLCERMEQSM